MFIVTNGQIPEWLDVNHPKVEIITHEMIFPDSSVLPTFSSSSIEMNLHRIPGLSDYFIYFNDDVFLGRAVYPYDFYTLEKGQLLYYSWDVPKCSEKCLYENLGDGFCDRGCFNPECGYDLGDCKDEEYIPEVTKKGAVLWNSLLIEKPIQIKKSQTTKDRCADGCPFLWIGDGVYEKMIFHS